MPQRLVLLHLGAHRTGTTYLQSTFRENAEKLADRRVRYMRLQDVPPVYRSYLAARDALLAGKQSEFDRGFAPVEDYLADFRHTHREEHLLISYEGILGAMSFRGRGLYPEHATLLRRFVDIFEDEAVEGAFAFRDYAAFLESTYSQLLQSGHDLSFDQHIEGVDLARLSWLPVIDTLKHMFATRLALWSYEDFCQSESDLLEWLFRRSFAISSHFLAPADKSVNPSLSVAAAPLVTVSNRLLGRKPALRTAANRRIRKLFPAGRLPRRCWLNDQAVASLRHQYADDVREIRNRVADVYRPPVR